jgi:hypothetical protein
MKSLKYLIVVFIVIIGWLLFNGALSATSNAFSWSFWSSKINNNGVIKSKLYLLETNGNDGRVYIFTNPKTNEECTFIVVSDGAGLSCK